MRRRPTTVAADRRRHHRAWVPYLFVAPAMAVFLLFVGLPFLHAVWLSFFDWDGITVGTWTGLDNYRDDPQRRHHPQLVRPCRGPGGVLRLDPDRGRAGHRLPVPHHGDRGGTVFRAAIYLPQVMSGVVIGVIWTWIYATDGSINEFLRAIGLGALARPWLGDFTWALPAIGMIGAWVGIGICMVLFGAGIQQIDGNLYDAARVDGAGRIREFFAVTLPALRYELGVALTLTIVGALKTFDLVFVTTRGGPGTSTQVPGLQLYTRAFLDGRVGQASAIAVVLSVLVFLVTVGIDRIATRGRE